MLLQRLGVSPRSLAQLVSETFNEMIFIHGDVHCDPHAANMVGMRSSRQVFGMHRYACMHTSSSAQYPPQYWLWYCGSSVLLFAAGSIPGPASVWCLDS